MTMSFLVMPLLLLLVVVISIISTTTAFTFTSSSGNSKTLNTLRLKRTLDPQTQLSLPCVASESAIDHKAPPVEIDRRRNFAIISHPDAGKTTLTEKLLLFGGAIQDAGAVKARKDQRQTTSDWMEIEKARGISVSSTVLSFEYFMTEGRTKKVMMEAPKFQLNLLDTPGHQDFSEDTYRTLAAADNCVMLVDGAKGIEDRTRKLFQVVQMRKLPIFTFVNKLDRPSLSPFELIDQIEGEFKLECCPMNWPIGDGYEFQGVYDRASKKVHLFEKGNRKKKVNALIIDVKDKDLPELITRTLYDKLMEDIEVLDSLMPEIDMESIRMGLQTPMFFGSAMTNFGVQLFLDTFLNLASKPYPREAIKSSNSAGGSDVNQDVIIEPGSDEFTGFVFKLQANLDPKHRDRMAFIRVCSGTFRKGMKVGHSRMKKTINLSSAQSLFAQDREAVLEAYPGDVIGIHNPGCFSIGDTIYTGSARIAYPGIPSFSPEKFAYIRNPNPSTYKKFQKGLSELLDEGAVQMLRDRGDDGMSMGGTPILAAVGQLQFEVVSYRLKAEYGVDCLLEPISYTLARWVGGGWEAVDKVEKEGKLYGVGIVQDRWQRPVLLFRNPWKVTQLAEDAKGLNMEPWAMPPSQFV